jgi:hypothetical protein
VKDLYNENYKTPKKQMTPEDGKASHVYGLKELLF